MPTTPAFRRAQALMGEDARAVTTSKILGVVHSLLVLSLAAVGSLLVLLVVGLNDWDDIGAPPRQISDPTFYVLDGVSVSFDQMIGRGLNKPAWVLSVSPKAGFSGRMLGGLLQWGCRVILPLGNNLGALTTLLATGLVLALTLALVARARRGAMADASTTAAAGLRKLIHRQMYRLGQSSLPTEGVGPVVNLFTREVNDVCEGLFTDLDFHPRIVVLVVGWVLFSLLVSWPLSLFLAALGGLTWYALRSLRESSDLAAQAATRDAALQLSLLQEDLSLLRTVRVYGMEVIDKERFDEHNDRYRAAEASRIRSEATLRPSNILLIGAALTLGLGVVGWSVLQGRISNAAVLTLLGALGGMIEPTRANVRSRRISIRAIRSAGAIEEFLARSPELQQTGGAHFLPPLRERITFENVTIESVSGRTLLDGFSAEIRAGIRTSILGLDEDARLALACLIPRLIDPKIGRVRIDGLDLRDVTLESIRAQVATVLQADLLFTDTIKANIGLGDASYSLPKIIEAAKLAHAHQFIQDLPLGYDATIGPLGDTYLTTDQRFQIALARALLHDPSILIIEEPVESLSEGVKSLLDDTIARLATPGRTLIFLPHRLSTIRSSDHVIVIHNGRVDSAGPPHQLQTDSKLYRHLQYVEFNQFATGEIEAGQMNG